MKKILISFIALFVFISAGHKLDYDFKLGPVHETKLPHRTIIPIGILDNNYYVATNYSHCLSSKNFIYKLDLDNKLISKKECFMNCEDDESTFDNFIETKAGFFAYSGYYKKKEDTNTFCSSKLENGSLKKVKKKVLKKINPKDNRPLSSPKTSQNKAFVGFSNIVRKPVNSEQHLKVILFDENLDFLWQNSIPLPLKYKRMRVVNYEISNQGEVVLLIKLKNDDGIEINPFNGEDFMVYHLGKEGLINKHIIDIGESLPSDAGISYSNNDHVIYVLGSYKDKETMNIVDGIFHYRIDVETKKVNKKTVPFSNKIRNKILNDRVSHTGKKNAFGLLFKTLRIDEEGFTFLAELNYIPNSIYSEWNLGLNDNDYLYYAGHIVVGRFDKSGDLVNMNIIQKKVLSGRHNNISYSVAFNNDKIFLVYNEQVSKVLKNNCKLSVLSKTGEIEEEKILFDFNSEGKTNFQTDFTMSNEEMLIIGGPSNMSKHKHSFQYGILQFD